jgi:hypothetical protein
MGSGASMPMDNAISHVTTKMELTSHQDALKGVDGPILITGKAVIIKGDALRIPLCGKLGVYHHSTCHEYFKGKHISRIEDVQHLDFALVDMNNPTLVINVPFSHMKSHLQLMCDDRNMEGIKKSTDLEERQQKFLRKNKFEPNEFALFGMKVKPLSFSEKKIVLDQPISMVCTVKDKWVDSVRDLKYATNMNWNANEKLAWKSCFKQPCVVITDRFKCPRLSTLGVTPHNVIPSPGHQNQPLCAMPTVGQQPMVMPHQQQQYHSQQPIIIPQQQQQQQFHSQSPMMMQHQQQQYYSPQPMIIPYQQQQQQQQQQFYSQQPMHQQQQHHQYHSQQPVMTPQPQQFYSQQPMMPQHNQMQPQIQQYQPQNIHETNVPQLSQQKHSFTSSPQPLATLEQQVNSSQEPQNSASDQASQNQDSKS